MSTTRFSPDPHEGETVSPADFQAHPLDRENPFARPDPSGYRADRCQFSALSPFDELIERGAMLDGFRVEVIEVIPTGDGFEGEATVKHPEIDEREVVDISELESPPKYDTAEVKTTVSPPEPSIQDSADGIAGDGFAESDLAQWAKNPCTDGNATEVQGYYEQEIAQREHIIESCPVDVHCSTVNRRWGHRHKLMSFYEARPGAAASCETLIIDSGVNRWGSPDDVLEVAQRYDADYVFATDVTGIEKPFTCPVSQCSSKFEEEGNVRKHIDTKETGNHKGVCAAEFETPELVTDDHNRQMPSTGDPGIETQEDAAIEGLRRFMDRAEELGIDDRVILPLQPPYMDFLDRVEAETDWLDRVSYVALGGMKVLNVHEKVRGMFEVRERLGDEMQIHALDPSTNPIILRTLYENPDLVDSLDVSTPEVAPSNNKIPDATWKQDRHLFPRGDDITTIRAVSSARLTLQIAYMISPLCNEETYREISDKLDDTDSKPDKTTESEEGQATLSAF